MSALPMARFRFRLVTLFALVTLCCLALGFGVTVVKRANAQRQFMEYLCEEYGPTNRPTVYVRYSHEVDSGQPYFGSLDPRHFVTDLLHPIVEIRFADLDSAEIDPDDEAKRLSAFTSLEVVEIQGISNVGVAYLCRLRKISSLTLGNSDITDRALTQLALLPRLRRLDIRHSSSPPVTVEAVARFRRLRTDVELLEDAWWTEDAERRAHDPN